MLAEAPNKPRLFAAYKIFKVSQFNKKANFSQNIKNVSLQVKTYSFDYTTLRNLPFLLETLRSNVHHMSEDLQNTYKALSGVVPFRIGNGSKISISSFQSRLGKMEISCCLHNRPNSKLSSN